MRTFPSRGVCFKVFRSNPLRCYKQKTFSLQMTSDKSWPFQEYYIHRIEWYPFLWLSHTCVWSSPPSSRAGPDFVQPQTDTTLGTLLKGNREILFSPRAVGAHCQGPPSTVEGDSVSQRTQHNLFCQQPRGRPWLTVIVSLSLRQVLGVALVESGVCPQFSSLQQWQDREREGSPSVCEGGLQLPGAHAHMSFLRL